MPYRILVLDDDENIGRFVLAALRKPKYETVWCRTLGEAIESVDQRRPDLALIDITLQAGETGWELLQRIRALPTDHHIAVVILTGAEDTLNRIKSLRMGADRYLLKPIEAPLLRRVVDELVGSREDLWWTFNLPADQLRRIRELFFDGTTELPTLAVVVEELRQLVENGVPLQVFCLEIEPLFRIGERNYWEVFDRLRREFVRGLRVMVSPIVGNDVIIATSHTGANDFYCFVTPRRDQVQTTRALERSARSAIRALPMAPEIADEVMIFAGGATTQPLPVFAPRMLYNAVREAKDSAERRETRYYHALRERLARAVFAKSIRTVYQPVISLATGETYGFEALSRGPAGSEIENPEVIFEVARDFDLVWDLERLCIENVQPVLGQLTGRGLLFFNLESHFIQQLQQRGLDVFRPFFDFRESVVIEVTERSAIRDYRTFRNTLHNLKAMGFRIAIDDCGSGYATLEAVAELQPDYLKVGHSLFHGIENNPVRSRLVDLVARAAEAIGAETIAEAIETDEQLRICRELGIQHGQGFLFARPASWDEISHWRG